ncbi:kinase domain protein [Dictyocaulus viviparus]|uniref:Sulfhydryl oxidase n=1 Tax=Dictyocaulus viviparus TaxID=29172 RepID=A0A0D8XJ69_DICVI|nr:kinase domain protein [Dictyocaulus viviparus]
MEVGHEDKTCRACISVEELMKRAKQFAKKSKEIGVESGSDVTTSSHDFKNCPVDKEELGRSTWNLLHTVSVYYPEKPMEIDKQTISVFIDSLAKLYPCDFCAKDLQKDLKEDPPKLGSRKELALWMCQLHNKKTSLMMVSNQQWVSNADAFLANPPLKLDLERVAWSGEVCRRGRRSRSDNGATSKNSMLRVLLAAFLDVFCETLPKTHREHVRNELSLTLVRLKVVPSLIFAEEFSSVRKSFAVVLSSVLYDCFTSDPNVDCRLTIETCGNLLSRYRTDFEEIQQIGTGGFGTVWKVKSLVDKCFYAIKRIPVKSNVSSVAAKVLNEVHILAMLHHENIVRYHSGWTEVHQVNANRNGGDHHDDFVKITELDDSSADDVVQSYGPLDSVIKDSEPSNSPVLNEQGSNIVTSNNEFSSASANSKMKFWARGKGDEATFSEFSSDHLGTTVPHSSTRIVKILDPIYKVRMSLWRTEIFIQMELCHCNLEKHFNDRNARIRSLGLSDLSVDGNFNRDLAIQMFSGLEYIHQNNVIHRDIKPSNIFLKRHGGRFRVLLGDFGLACGHNAANNSCSPNISSDCCGCRSSDTICVPIDHSIAVDIYSAGLVLFEAYHVFNTEMEKFQAISDVRLGKSKDELLARHVKFTKNWPSVASTIFEMTATDAASRPTATQLLQRYINIESRKVAQLKNIIRNQKAQLIAAEKRIQELLSLQLPAHSK